MRSTQCSERYEQHLTIKQIADRLGVGRDKASRLVASLPSVLNLGRSRQTRGQRPYRILRVPRSAFERFLRERAA